MVQTQGFLNEDGSSNLSWSDILKMGTNLYSQNLKSSTDTANANAAIQLEKLKIQQAQAQAAAANSTSSGVAAKIKAYGLPIAIIGVMVIGGISAYFYFKKKA